MRCVGGMPMSSFAGRLRELFPFTFGKSGSSSRRVGSSASCPPDASQPRISCGSSVFISSHCRSSSWGTNKLSYSIDTAEDGGLSGCVLCDRCSCVEDPFSGRIDRSRRGGGGICVLGVDVLEACLLTAIGAGVGVGRAESRGTVDRVEGGASSPSTSPRVITVNSA